MSYGSFLGLPSVLKVDDVVYNLRRCKFPFHKWRYLAVSLKCADHIRSIESKESDLVGVIAHWLSVDPESSWNKLIEAVVLSQEVVVARNLATEHKIKLQSENFCQITCVFDAILFQVNVLLVHALLPIVSC